MYEVLFARGFPKTVYIDGWSVGQKLHNMYTIHTSSMQRTCKSSASLQSTPLLCTRKRRMVSFPASQKCNRLQFYCKPQVDQVGCQSRSEMKSSNYGRQMSFNNQHFLEIIKITSLEKTQQKSRTEMRKQTEEPSPDSFFSLLASVLFFLFTYFFLIFSRFLLAISFYLVSVQLLFLFFLGFLCLFYGFPHFFTQSRCAIVQKVHHMFR